MHPIIQAEVDELKKLFPYITNEEVIAEPRNKDDGRSAELLTILMRSEAKRLNDFVAAALHRAIEKAGKEIVEQEMVDPAPHATWTDPEHGWNEHRSLALSKLDTIINFKE